MDRISEDIKNGTYKPVYLIFGEEAYLRENYRKKLVNALTTPSDTLNYSYFMGTETSVEEVISLCSTLPFMAEKRVVLVKDSGWFKSAREELLDYLSSPAEDTVLIFDEEKVDKRLQNYKAVEKLGGLAVAEKLKDAALKNWVVAYLKHSGKQVRESTVELLITRVGDDLYLLSTELEKLIAKIGEREILEDRDVEELTSRSPQDKIFQMIDEMAQHRRNNAVSLYYEMLAAKESPYGILSLIERHFRILYIVKELSAKHVPAGEIARDAGVRPGFVKKYQRQAETFSRKQIAGVIEDCVSSDADSKMGLISDKLAVELLIIRYSG